MNPRRERYLKQRGIYGTEMEEIACELLNNIKDKGKTLKEAKFIIKNMELILIRSETYAQDTLLSNIPLRKLEEECSGD